MSQPSSKRINNKIISSTSPQVQPLGIDQQEGHPTQLKSQFPKRKMQVSMQSYPFKYKTGNSTTSFKKSSNKLLKSLHLKLGDKSTVSNKAIKKGISQFRKKSLPKMLKMSRKKFGSPATPPNNTLRKPVSLKEQILNSQVQGLQKKLQDSMLHCGFFKDLFVVTIKSWNLCLRNLKQGEVIDPVKGLQQLIASSSKIRLILNEKIEENETPLDLKIGNQKNIEVITSLYKEVESHFKDTDIKRHYLDLKNSQKTEIFG